MSRQPSAHVSLPNVSVACVLPAAPTRAAAFQQAMTAVLHASFSFGRERPAQLVYSYDSAGEEYADPLLVPAGSITSLAQAIDCLSQSAMYYNQSIGLNFTVARTHVPVTGRVYDETDAMVISLDFESTSWRRLLVARRSARNATIALIDASRVLFTLLPVTYLLIGPTEMLLDLPPVPQARLLHAAPIAMLGSTVSQRRHAYLASALHTEQLPRGTLVVQQWDAGTVIPRRGVTSHARAAPPKKT